MATTTLTKSTFTSTVDNNDIVIVDYWAEWCGPCRMFGPIFEASSLQNPDIVHAKVDTEAEPELFDATGQSGIPTIQVYREGILVFSQAGALPAPALAQLIDAIRGLDMDEVRAAIAQESAAP